MIPNPCQHLLAQPQTPKISEESQLQRVIPSGEQEALTKLQGNEPKIVKNQSFSALVLSSSSTYILY